ncbi:MAG: hypothetical protein ACREV6_21345 [Clostridium sp.]|uniref:hypothetical protein n=1 Tax=Clostridium sp. TaxID=1506 RepID=UPI003D6CE659
MNVDTIKRLTLKGKSFNYIYILCVDKEICHKITELMKIILEYTYFVTTLLQLRYSLYEIEW